MIRWRALYPLLSLFLLALLAEQGSAQTEDQEVFLTFRYENVVNQYVTAIYREDGTFLLPHQELFRALELDAQSNLSTLTLSGFLPGQGEWSLNYRDGIFRMGNQRIELDPDRIHMTEMDFYLHPALFLELFDLEFQVNFNQLNLQLESTWTVPAVARAERERQRGGLSPSDNLVPDYYPLEYDRERHLLNGAFLDYNLTATQSDQLYSSQFQGAIGTEVAGGDLQGTLFGNVSKQSATLRSSGLRWQYGIRDNPLISRITVGQTNSRGLLPVTYSGAQITNEPLEPRLLFDMYQYRGQTTPQAEVELYRNNTLVDFLRADNEGEYRFKFPLTYGTSRYDLRIYHPNGEISERQTRIQIPFEFNPPGELTYRLSGGQLDTPLPGTVTRNYMGRGRLNVGLTHWLTLSGGAEYFEGITENRPTLSGALSTRLFQQYLLQFEMGDRYFYRTNASVVYPSGVSLSGSYERQLEESLLYNRSGNQSRIQSSIFLPIQLGPLPLFFRTSISHEERSTTRQTRYTLDLNSRIGRANLRFSWRDTQVGPLQWTTTPSSRLLGSITYSFSRSRQTAALVRGLYLRGQGSWLAHSSELYDAELSLSRRIFTAGRIQLGGGKNFAGDFLFGRFSLSFDFNRVRTNTTARYYRESFSASQNLRGSIGVDPETRYIQMNQRQQVGGAALAIRLYIDESGSGTYEEGDPVVYQNAVRVDRGGGTITFRDGVSYITQLQPYRRYNLSINKNSLANPMLMPAVEEFSAITDPNQFKVINIPLYLSGIVDGRVVREQNGITTPVGGARLMLVNLAEEGPFQEFEQEIRTFSDGGFYAYEVPPGPYELRVAQDQLDATGLQMDPGPLEFEVRATAQGDFVEGLRLTLTSQQASIVETPEAERDPSEDLTIEWLEPTARGTRVGRLDTGTCRFPIQLGSYPNERRAIQIAQELEEKTGEPLILIYNSLRHIYAIRTEQSWNLSDAMDQLLAWRETLLGHDLSIVARCDSMPENADSGAIEHSLQLGAFSTMGSARRLKERMDHELGLDLTIMEPDDQVPLYRVRYGPLRATEAHTLAQRIQGLELVNDLYLVQSRDSRGLRLTFDYMVQVGVFATQEQASACSIQLREKRGLESYILLDRQDRSHLLLDHRYRDWNTVRQLRSDLRCPDSPTLPMIHLIETIEP
ncbi:MAG: SPOR domain-containing protein [Balneolaceae bacterium]